MKISLSWTGVPQTSAFFLITMLITIILRLSGSQGSFHFIYIKT